MWSPREQGFLDLIEERIGVEQTARYKSLILKYATEDYRIQQQLLFWRALIEDELLSSLDKKFTEKYLPDSLVTNNLWGLFALLQSKNEERYKPLQESESRGMKLIGFLSQSFIDYEPGVDKERISDAVKYIARELDMDVKSTENIEYAQFIIHIVESYQNYFGPRSDQARRFSDLYPSLCRIVISDLYRNDDFDFGYRHIDFKLLQMSAASFLESVGDQIKSCIETAL